jgi:hypothetical protein
MCLENYNMYARWCWGAAEGGGKQVVCNLEAGPCSAAWCTLRMYSGSVDRIYTWDVKSCGGPGRNTSYVRNHKCGVCKNLKCKSWKTIDLCVLLQIVYLDNIASPAVTLNEESRNVSVYCLILALTDSCASGLINENE